MMGDYGDWAGYDTLEAKERRALRTAAMRSRHAELNRDYDVIHGHFVADKYQNLFPRAEYVGFFRDPYQQSVAHYYFLLRNPQRDHPEERTFHDAKMTLHDYLRWDAFYNHQSQYLGSVSIDDFAMVGLSEHFSRSIARFETIFGRRLGEQRFANVNPDRLEDGYPIDAEIRNAVDKYRAADVELYRRAQEIFAKQAALEPA